MSKLFKCKVDWHDSDNEPSYGSEEVLLAASGYATAAEQLVGYYGNILSGYSIYELQTPILIGDLTDE
jgi:hypothetical protein